MRDVPLCPLHLYVLHEKLNPPTHHQTSSHFLVQELSLSPRAGYPHPRAQDGQLVCDSSPKLFRLWGSLTSEPPDLVHSSCCWAQGRTVAPAVWLVYRERVL